jgi:hypothetical protein
MQTLVSVSPLWHQACKELKQRFKVNCGSAHISNHIKLDLGGRMYLASQAVTVSVF